MKANPDQDFVLKTIESRDVHFVRCWFSDTLGNLKSFAVIPNEIEEAFEEGVGFDGTRIEGFGTRQRYGMRAFPDASTFQILPWRPDSDAVARMFCSISNPDGSPFEGDSRFILKRMMDKAAKQGYVFNVCPALEFYYFKDSNGTEVLDNGGYFDMTTLDSATDLRRDTVLTLEKLGIPVEFSHHESGPSQHEIDLRYSDALSMADAVMTYKLVVKEIATINGVYASFMPKPMTDQTGSAMHIQQSLSDLNGNNLFFDPEAESDNYLSDIAKHYIAGLLKYAPEYTLITNQYVNSYKRLASDVDAPVFLSWSTTKRQTLIRVPRYRPEKESSCRVELRSPDPAANPYLAFAVLLAAGLKGIEEKLALGAADEDHDAALLSREALIEQGSKLLPLHLGEAIDNFANSSLMKEVLGEHVHSYLVKIKREEWKEYQEQVSSWELDRHLSVL
ncbi:MAG: glutamine synthetase family protein [Raoultibacter sp.]